MTTTDEWLPTPAAARILGVSPRTLKRWASEEDFFEPLKHWARGPFSNSSITWNVSACREVLHYRGIKADPERIADRLNVSTDRRRLCEARQEQANYPGQALQEELL